MYTEAVDSDLNYIRDSKKKLEKTCQDFEALFMSKMFSTMRSTIQDGGLVKKSMGEEIFTDMLDSEIAKQSSEGKGQQGLGLAKMLFDSMSKYVQDKNGNNFPEGKKGMQTSNQFLDLQKELSGTDVASRLNMIK